MLMGSFIPHVHHLHAVEEPCSFAHHHHEEEIDKSLHLHVDTDLISDSSPEHHIHTCVNHFLYSLNGNSFFTFYAFASITRFFWVGTDIAFLPVSRITVAKNNLLEFSSYSFRGPPLMFNLL